MVQCPLPRRRAALALVAALGLAAAAGSREAAANGRPPATSTINFRFGMESQIAAGMTFGLVVSRDGGATWEWVCEDAIGYGGMYDPDYVFSATGSLFATTFGGLKVDRDGCKFDELTPKFVSAIAQGPTGAIYRATADSATATNPGDAKIYRSDDDGATWPVAASPGIVNDWWQSLEVAPSNKDRVYLSGYRFEQLPGGGSTKKFLLFRSNDGGASFTPLPVTDLDTMPNSTIDVVGVSYTNPDHVYARVTLEDNAIADAIWGSTDGGQTWKRLIGKGSAISFLVRRSGELVVGTRAQGAARSTDNGDTWTDLASPPSINCLAENSAGEVWACTQNYGGGGSQSDGYGIMKSTDLATWQPVLKYQDIAAPVSCAGGTVQKDRCDVELWCGLCGQLGCDAKRSCATGGDGAGDRTDVEDGGGCCSAAPPAPAALLLGAGVGLLLLRPRRRRRRRA